MLTRELAIARYDFQHNLVLADRLTRNKHAHYRDYAARMLRVYREGIGQTRRRLHQSIRQLFTDEADCPSRRIDAFCKLLDDASEYETGRSGAAAALRRQVFQLAAPHHPLVTKADRLFNSCEASVKQQIAQQLKRPWSEIQRDLFADVMEFHRLREFQGFESPEALLCRYNVAQAQAVLYDAQQLTVWATTDFKVILRAAKLARLMHSIWRLPDGRYRLVLDGPASVLRSTRRYGVAMARFLPTLLTCRQWKMHAKVQSRWNRSLLTFRLSSVDRLGGNLTTPADFDSDVERQFAEKWGSEARDGWMLSRESEILHDGQKVFLPDFVFEHEDGGRVLMEIVGFWTPEYLAAKADTLRRFADQRIVLAVAQAVGDAIPSELTAPVVTYKTTLKIREVLAALDKARGQADTRS